MSSRDWKFRIEDILQLIKKIETYTEGMGLEEFISQDLVIDGVIRNFEVIGEACRHVPEEITSKFPNLPWKEMRGFRNVLIHEYFGVDIETVWHTAKTHLPTLKPQLKKLID